jgi:hypothetical protein
MIYNSLTSVASLRHWTACLDSVDDFTGIRTLMCCLNLDML